MRKHIIALVLLGITLLIEQHSAHRAQANPAAIAVAIGAAEIPQLIAGAAALISTMWYRAAHHEHSHIAQHVRQESERPFTMPAPLNLPEIPRPTHRTLTIEAPSAQLTHHNPATPLVTITQTSNSYRLNHADGFSFEVRVQPQDTHRHHNDAFTRMAYEQKLFEHAYQKNPMAIVKHLDTLAQALIGCNSDDLIERLECRLNLSSLQSVGYIHYHLERAAAQIFDACFSRDGSICQTEQLQEVSDALKNLFKKWGIKEDAALYAHPLLQAEFPKRHSWLHKLNPFEPSREKIVGNSFNAQLKEMIHACKQNDWCSVRRIQLAHKSTMMDAIADYYARHNSLAWQLIEQLDPLALHDPLTKHSLQNFNACAHNAATISTLNARSRSIETVSSAWHIDHLTEHQLQSLFHLLSTPALTSPQLLVQEVENILATAPAAHYQELVSLFYTEHGILKDFDLHIINAPSGLLERDASQIRSLINEHIARILEKPDKNPGCGKAVEHAPIITICVPPHEKVAITSVCIPENPLKEKNYGCKPLMPYKPIVYFTQDAQPVPQPLEVPIAINDIKALEAGKAIGIITTEDYEAIIKDLVKQRCEALTQNPIFPYLPEKERLFADIIIPALSDLDAEQCEKILTNDTIPALDLIPKKIRAQLPKELTDQAGQTRICTKHFVRTKKGLHRYLDMPELAPYYELCKQLREKYDGTIVSIPALGITAPIKINYEHIFMPEIHTSCPGHDEVAISGFHVDYNRSITQNKLITLIKQSKLPHDCFDTNWQFLESDEKTSTHFPVDWSGEKIIGEIINVINNPTECFPDNITLNKYKITGMTSNGAELYCFIKEIDNAISVLTAYPSNKS